VQRAVIDALPEIDVRRLLVLIGGVDPAPLQRAAAYTDMFGGPGMEGSVAAYAVRRRCCRPRPGRLAARRQRVTTW
jgi:hypothetical protein